MCWRWGCFSTMRRRRTAPWRCCPAATAGRSTLITTRRDASSGACDPTRLRASIAETPCCWSYRRAASTSTIIGSSTGRRRTPPPPSVVFSSTPTRPPMPSASCRTRPARPWSARWFAARRPRWRGGRPATCRSLRISGRATRRSTSCRRRRSARSAPATRAQRPSAGQRRSRTPFPRQHRLIDHEAPGPPAPEPPFDAARRAVKAELKRPRVEADVEEQLEAGGRARALELVPADEVLEAAKRPEAQPARGPHHALPGPIRRGEHEQATDLHAPGELLDDPRRRGRVLHHLARDDDVEALVAERETARIGDDARAARPRPRPRDQPLADVGADHQGPAGGRRRREETVAAAGVERATARQRGVRQTLVEDDLEAPAHVGGMVEALEPVGDAFVERFGRVPPHRGGSSRWPGGRSASVPCTARTT